MWLHYTKLTLSFLGVQKRFCDFCTFPERKKYAILWERRDGHAAYADVGGRGGRLRSPYGAAMTRAHAEAAHAFHRSFPQYEPTPLVALPRWPGI